MADYFIGIDSGTQSTRAVLVESNHGQIIASAARSHGLIEGLPPGHKEQDPSVWITAVKACLQQILAQSKVNRKSVLALGVSGQQHGLVPLDANGKVIRPAKLWCDTSTSRECAEITRRLGGTRNCVKRLGNAISPGFTAAKILWLKNKEPHHYKKLETVLLPHDYINYWLTGEMVMEAGDASGTALFNVSARKWFKPALQAIDPDLYSKLPTVKLSYEPIGRVRRGLAEEIGLGPEVYVSPGGGDNMMSAIGTGNVESGIVSASLGTSGTIYAYSRKPVIDPKGEIAAFCDSSGAWLPLLCTLNVTTATELCKRAFRYTNEQLTRKISQVPAGCKGLLLLPYFEGERTPNLPDGTGLYFGIRAETFQPEFLARAAMEGATLGMNYGLNRLKKLGIQPRQIRLTGGGSKNPVWRQMVADIFNLEVINLAQSESAAYGAALQAFWSYLKARDKRPPELHQICRKFVRTNPATRTSPIRKNVSIYQDLQKIFNAVTLQLEPAFGLHRNFIEKSGGLS